MHNIIQTMLHQFVNTYPQPGQPAQLELTVDTHDPDRDNAKFRLSDAGRCRLMRYWKRQGKLATSTMTPDVLLQMQAGNLIHAYIERAAHDTGILVASEDRLEDEHRIGHFDMIIKDVGGSRGHILYDIKTISSKKAYYMAKDGKQADPQHVAQVISYATLYRKFGGELDELRIAYVIRDTMEILEAPISHSAAAEADWNILIGAWICQEPPAANPEKWECRYCAYASDCASAHL
jgi:CRISPR/Cas system-associated exonuclease Cas4 (RecB family)